MPGRYYANLVQKGLWAYAKTGMWQCYNKLAAAGEAATRHIQSVSYSKCERIYDPYLHWSEKKSSSSALRISNFLLCSVEFSLYRAIPSPIASSNQQLQHEHFEYD